MRFFGPSILKPMVLSILTIAVMAFSHGVAKADEVSFAGYTNGCFNCGAPLNTSVTQTASLFGLMYVNSTFSGATSAGFLAFGGNPMAAPIQNVNNLGAFSLANSLATYTGNTFTLRVTFTVPTGVSGGGTQTFAATLTGSVNSVGTGGVLINFDNTPINFTFTQGAGGSFTFQVNDLSVFPGQVAEITGQITSATTVPEPTSMFLLGTGLLGAAGAVRRKFKGRS